MDKVTSVKNRIGCKAKDDLSWCCLGRRYSDNNIQDLYNRQGKVVVMERSTDEVSLPVKKVKKKAGERES